MLIKRCQNEKRLTDDESRVGKGEVEEGRASHPFGFRCVVLKVTIPMLINMLVLIMMLITIMMLVVMLSLNTN